MNLWSKEIRFKTNGRTRKANYLRVFGFVIETASIEKKLVIRFSVFGVSCSINEERCFSVLVTSMPVS